MNSCSLELAFALAFALLCTIGSPAAAQLGGNPGNADSCYSDCGVGGGTATQRCACDDACNVRGDFCSDRNPYCATSVAAPLRGAHDGKLEVLFGDSREWTALAWHLHHARPARLE